MPTKNGLNPAFRVIEIKHITGKLWTVTYLTEQGTQDFETVEALDHEEAYRTAMKEIKRKQQKS